MFLGKFLDAEAAARVFPLILQSQPDPSTVPAEGSDASGTAHGILMLRTLTHLHSVVGMSPLDILLMLPTIIQLIQTLAGDFAKIIEAIKSLKKPAA